MELPLKLNLLKTSILAALFLPACGTLVDAQSNQNFDGGTGTWDAGVTPDWDGTAVWTNGNYATFNPPSTVTVSGTVVTGQINIGQSSSFTGGTIDLTGTQSNYSGITNYNGSTLTINSQLVLSDSGPDTQTFMDNYASGTMTFGNVDFGAYDYVSNNPLRMQVNAFNNGGAIVLSGAYTTSTAHGGSINFGADTGQGTYTLASTADFTQFNTNTGDASSYYEQNSFSFTGAVLNIETSKFNGNQTMAFFSATAGNQVNIVGSQNIALNIYNAAKNDIEPNNGAPDDGDGVSDVGQMIFNQSTADQSTWSGNVNQNGASVTLDVVSGGRLNFAANLGSSTPLGLTVNAAGGVVVLSGNNNYGLSDGNGVNHGNVAATINSGTVLITNPSGTSAFGNNTGVVNLKSGATLGGNGYSTPTIVAAAADSVIAPGDPGQVNLGIASSLGTLHLNGGITAANGLTLDFKLSGVSSDTIDLGTSFMTLNGNITFNFTGTPTISVANGNGTYIIMTNVDFATTAGNSANANFVFNAPAGYTVSNYGTVSGGTTNVNGNDVDAGHDYLYVQFAATPEPSTYGMMGLGLLALVVIRRFRRLNA